MAEKYLRQRSDGRWEVRMVEGHTADGKPYSPSRYFDSRAEARKHINKILAERKRKTVSTITLGEWAERCIKSHRGYLQDTTLNSYQHDFDKQIKSHKISRKALSDIKRSDIQEWIGSRRKDGGSPYSAKSLQKFLTLMKWFLHCAEREGLIQPINTTGINLKITAIKERNILQPGEAEAILAATKGNHLHNIIAVAMMTGLRRSELLALKWEDINLETGEYIVRHKLTPKNEDIPVLKSKAAYRIGKLSPSGIEVLKRQKSAMNELKLKNGILFKDRGYVFADDFGNAWHPGSISTEFSMLSKRVLGRTIGIHSFRHLYATTLIRKHLDDMTIANALGHSSANMTREIYAEYYDDSRNMVAEAIEEAVGKNWVKKWVQDL